ncbi:hypothetical protein SOVF_174870 [Spinacia oleracea]|nr:hypothetical protein SOVF_174870 [Spinacia oleracea]
MASRFFLFCLMFIAVSMMTSVTLPATAHRLLKLPNPTNTNHIFEEILIPTILMPKLRNPKRSLLQIDIHPTIGNVPVNVGGILPGVTGLIPVITPP